MDDVAPTRPLSISELKAKLAVLEKEARARAEEESKRRSFEDHDHPAPPTLDPLLMKRARKVWVEMHGFGLEHAPWHHEEIWCWAGSTEQGQVWLAEEVLYWERWVNRQRTIRKITMIRICEEGCSLYDGTTLRNLDRKLERDRDR